VPRVFEQQFTISSHLDFSTTTSSHHAITTVSLDHSKRIFKRCLQKALQQLNNSAPRVRRFIAHCNTQVGTIRNNSKIRNIYLLELGIVTNVDAECRDSCESNSHTPALQWFTALATHAILCGQKRRAHFFIEFSQYWDTFGLIFILSCNEHKVRANVQDLTCLFLLKLCGYRASDPHAT
jgi:hypothetical protein